MWKSIDTLIQATLEKNARKKKIEKRKRNNIHENAKSKCIDYFKINNCIIKCFESLLRAKVMNKKIEKN